MPVNDCRTRPRQDDSQVTQSTALSGASEAVSRLRRSSVIRAITVAAVVRSRVDGVPNRSVRWVTVRSAPDWYTSTNISGRSPQQDAHWIAKTPAHTRRRSDRHIRRAGPDAGSACRDRGDHGKAVRQEVDRRDEGPREGSTPPARIPVDFRMFGLH